MQKVALFMALLLIGLFLIIWNDLHLSKGEKLLVAINYGDDKAVKEYLDKGFDPDFKATRNIPSPITKFIFTHIKEFIGFDIRKKTGLGYISIGDTPLCRSIEYEEIKIFAMLLKSGADPNLESSSSQFIRFGGAPITFTTNELMASVLKKYGAIGDMPKITCHSHDDLEFIDIEDRLTLTKLIEEK